MPRRWGAGHSQSRADTPYTKLGFWRLVEFGGIALVVLLTILRMTLFEIVVTTLLVILVWGLFLIRVSVLNLGQAAAEILKAARLMDGRVTYVAQLLEEAADREKQTQE